jgi:hypothetical protein
MTFSDYRTIKYRNMTLFRLLIMLGESNTYHVPHRERSEWIYSSHILMDMHRKDPDTRITKKVQTLRQNI